MGKQWARQLFKEKRNPQTTYLRSLRTLKLVRVMGLEPIRQRHTPLKRACLPIPAHSHLTTLLLYHILIDLSRAFFKKVKYCERGTM